MSPKKMFFEKFREAAASVLPITLIVAVMCFSFVPVTTDLLLAFLVGAVMLIVGMGLFTMGSDVSMTQIGSHMGAKRLLLAFQPHTYTRTIAFFEDFVDVLKQPDKVYLAEIYAAREKNTLGISSADLAREIPNSLYFSTFLRSCS